MEAQVFKHYTVEGEVFAFGGGLSRLAYSLEFFHIVAGGLDCEIAF